NSKHATASTTLDVTAAKQMRATLIYFAPFLQPCKNVVTSTATTTSAQATTTKMSAKVLQQQQTHVHRSNRLNSSSRNNHNNNNNNNNKNAINMTGSRPCFCCSNSTTVAKPSAPSLTCTHHNKFKDDERTTTTRSSCSGGGGDETPRLHSSHNKLRQDTQQQQLLQEGSQEQQQQRQQLTTLSTSSLCCATTTSTAAASASLSTSFVNNTNNNRSTKYLRERNRRNIAQQKQKQQQQEQQSLEQTLKRKTHASTLLLKQQGEQEQEKLQRNLMCVGICGGSGDDGSLYILKEPGHNNTNVNTNTNLNQQQMASSATTVVVSRCHCYNRQHNNIMLSNVQQQQQQQQTNKLKLLYKTEKEIEDNEEEEKVAAVVEIYAHNCDDQLKTYVEANVQRGELKKNKKLNSNLRLRFNGNLNEEEQQEQELKLEQQDKNSYINFNELLFHSHPTTTTKSIPTSTSTITTTSQIIPTLIASTQHSYTTILNKECRCFTQQQKQERDTITITTTTGSESINRTQTPLAYCRTTSVISSDSNSGRSGSSSSIISFYQSLAKIWPQTLSGCSRLSKTIAVSRWLFMWLLMAMLSTSAHCWTGRNDVPTNCTFPARWEGSWFLSGYQQSIHIKGSQFSYRGKCVASDGNKYLIVDEKGCHRCLVIYEKHNNVLQYKESECEGDSMYMHQTNPSAMAMRSVLNQKTNNNADFCKGRETLQNLCDQIPGDALLYSLFRESAEPVKCPLKGPFIFTYNRGNGECKNPVSNIESCTEDSRLLLSFQACPDVVGTESTVEELTCLATWKDGNSRYLVGLVSHHHAISNEERYRCFVYEKISSLMDLGHFSGPSMSTSKDAEYKLAQSGDATCNGLDSAEVGSRIMSLRKPPVTERCDFPVWFKGPRHWHVLMGNAVYNYHTNDGSIHIIKPNGYMETRALCEQINKQTSTEMIQSGFMCMMFYRRDTHVIEIQTGKPASRLEDACAPDHFDINKTPYITLLASNPDPQICPMEGLYSLRGAIGPPYLTTRHKRNHNKAHGLHNHHHQYEGNSGREFMHKRHSSLSFRNSNHDENNAWHSNTRGLPVRSRRDASSTVNPLSLAAGSNQSHTLIKTTQEILVVGNNTNVGFVQDPISDTRLRSRRNVPECVTNYKAQRQLWVGCTEPNVIDVRPLCNDEGDEEYSCHGSWSENGTVFIIARHKGTKHGVCISYRPTEGTAAKLVVGDACYRGTQKPPEHHLVANLSVFAEIVEDNKKKLNPELKKFFFSFQKYFKKFNHIENKNIEHAPPTKKNKSEN
ncbi:hypothetical protein DOY81_006450, partial [Sarcophaga bullata]